MKRWTGLTAIFGREPDRLTWNSATKLTVATPRRIAESYRTASHPIAGTPSNRPFLHYPGVSAFIRLLHLADKVGRGTACEMRWANRPVQNGDAMG